MIADPRVVNPLTTDFIDHENPRGSSDDTLTLHTTNGVSNDSRKSSSLSVEIIVHDSSSTGHPSILRDDSTDSDDGILNS